MSASKGAEITDPCQQVPLFICTRIHVRFCVCVCVCSRKTCPEIFCRMHYSFFFFMCIFYIIYPLSVFPQMLAICLQFSRRTVTTEDPTSNKAEFSVFRVLMIKQLHMCLPPSLEVGKSSHLDTLSGCPPHVASEVSGTSGKEEQVEMVG